MYTFTLKGQPNFNAAGPQESFDARLNYFMVIQVGFETFVALSTSKKQRLCPNI